MAEHEHRLEPEPMQETERLTYYLHKDIAPRDLYNWLIDQFNRGTQVVIDWQENVGETTYRKAQVDAILSALDAHNHRSETNPAKLSIQGYNLYMLKTGLQFNGCALDSSGHIAPLTEEAV